MELGNDKSVFGFSGGPRKCMLFLGTPRDWIVTEVENEDAGRGKIILIASPIGVQVGM